MSQSYRQTAPVQQSAQAASGGIGLGGAVFIVFLVLKLTGVIAWSWWWVTAPLWIPAALFAVVALCMLLFAVVATVVSK